MSDSQHAPLTASDIYGPLTQLMTKLHGVDGRKWSDALTAFNAEKNPWPGIIIIDLTPSLKAGINTLEDLCSDGYIPTKNWDGLQVEPIDNNGAHSSTNRTMTFRLENGQMVEIKVSTQRCGSKDVVHSDEGRTWAPYLVFVKSGDRMECLINNGPNKPFFRWSIADKPLPGTTWRAPTDKEVGTYKTAIQNRDEDSFLEVYHVGLIDWNECNNDLGGDTHLWVRKTLEKTLQKTA